MNRRHLVFLLTLLLATMFVAGSAKAQPTELFFSEYIEGSSNNKALEIYNGTGAAVDLAASGYNVQMFFNGSTSAGMTVNLNGTVADGDVFVLAQASADPTILAQADQTNGAGWFNGDDAVVLRKGTTVIDVIGQIGFDPGSEWGSDLTSTADNTLRRAESICGGDTDGSNAFDPAAEWLGFATNTFDGLGSHTVSCGGSVTTPGEVLLTELVVTPTGGEFIEIYNPTGATIDLSNYYVTDATFAGGSTYYYNIVTGNNAGGGGFGDFHARFPDGATIAAGTYQTIALAGSANFVTAYGLVPNYELFNDGSDNGEQQMREALAGSINGQGGLTNGGEVVILYYWDGNSDLVLDMDYALWGDKDEAVDKTGVSIDGPDSDSDPSTYLADTAIGNQDVIAPGAHGSGESWQRDDLTEGTEATSGGNGVNGENETSENVSTTWCTNAPTPGAMSVCDAGSGAQEAKIHEVQGTGANVAITNLVKVEAIVVADYQRSDQLRGFFVQEEDADADGDPNTSEGIFVFCSGCATDVAVGDLVQVTAVPEDFFGMSQLDLTEPGGALSVVSSGNALPSPATIDLPASGSTRDAATFENVEGMLVMFADQLVVSEYFELARYGQLVLTADARPQQFTDANEPSVSGYDTFLADLNSKRIILDDDNNFQNDALAFGSEPDEPYFWPRPGLSISNFIRGGDSINNLTGVLHWSFAGQSGTDAWRVRPVLDSFNYDFTSNNSRTEKPDAVGGTMKVASFNVLNYFTTIDSRGADSVVELDRQREKIAAAVCAMDADVIGLIEIENNGTVAISDLLNGTNGINANCGPYDFIDTGEIGDDAIAVAFIYKTATVEPVGDFAILDSSVDSRFNDDRNRPALAQTFMQLSTGGELTVVVNHLKSKGSPCADIGDPDIGDGQGNCNVTRTLAAEAMVDWLATDPTGSGDADFLIIGDLNAYRNEDPIDAIEEGADDTLGTDDDYTDLLDAFIGPSAYSYLFDGQLGYLDHALANNSLLPKISDATVWHINADEIPVFDYNDDIRDPGEASFERESTSEDIYEDDPYRASDHDPVIVGVCLDETAPTLEVSVSPDKLWPPNHQYVTVTAEVIASDNFDSNPTVSLVSVESNEPDDGLGDGDTPNDIVIIDDDTFDLRAERSGTGDGRIYTITYEVTDACGNSTIATAEVTVPKSQGRNK